MFENEIRDLAEKRRLVAELDAEVETRRLQWEKENRVPLAKLVSAKRALAEADHGLRLDVIASYEATGQKKPHPKLGIRVSKVVKIVDEQAALEYAKRYIPTLIVLDTTGFKQYVKGVAGIKGFIASELGEIVAFTEKVTATIAKDLED